MNKELYDKALEVHQWLMEQDVVKEYKKYEIMIKDHEKLKLQEEKLKQLQKEIVNKKHKDEDCDDLIKEYEVLKDEFFNHPIVHNYLLLKEEVNLLIQQMTSIINQNINQ